MMSRSSKGRWVALLTVMMVFGVAGNAAAHGTDDQSSESFNLKSCLTGFTPSLAQTFTPAADNLTGVDVHIVHMSPGSEVDMEVELTIRTAPATVAVLARVENIPLSDGWNHIDLAVPIDLMPGNTYAIRLDLIRGDPCWSVDTSNPYPGGQFWSGRSDSSRDLNFQTYYAADNQPPVADPNGPYLVGAGASVAFDGTGSYDPDAGDSLAYSWVVDFGGFDDATAVQPTYNAPAAAGTYTVTLTVDDGNGGTDHASTTVVVNRPPTITDPAQDAIGDEGGTLSASGRFDDPDGGLLTVTADNTVGTFAATGGGGWMWTYPTTDNVIEHTINVTAEDGHGASATDSFDFSAANVPPDMGPITGAPVGPIPVGTTVTLAAAFTDPGTADTHEATWSWGDGSGPVTSPASSSILYDTAGVYSATVTVTVTDDDGGSDTETLELVAVVGDLEERKQAVRDDLAELSPTLDDKDAKKLEKALKHLDKSLTAKYWVDGDTLVAKDGKKVFAEESKAVKDLEKIKSTDVSGAIASLVAIDKELAQGAIKDAQDRYDAICSVPTTRECEKAAKELAKAAKEMDKAQKELAKGHFAHAIGKYKKAWEKADKALKALPELDLGGDA